MCWRPQKRDAKKDCAAQCIRALGLRVSGDKLIAGSDTNDEDLPRCPKWKKEKLIQAVQKLNQTPAAERAAKESYHKYEHLAT